MGQLDEGAVELDGVDAGDEGVMVHGEVGFRVGMPEEGPLDDVVVAVLSITDIQDDIDGDSSLEQLELPVSGGKSSLQVGVLSHQRGNRLGEALDVGILGSDVALIGFDRAAMDVNEGILCSDDLILEVDGVILHGDDVIQIADIGTLGAANRHACDEPHDCDNCTDLQKRPRSTGIGKVGQEFFEIVCHKTIPTF